MVPRRLNDTILHGELIVRIQLWIIIWGKELLIDLDHPSGNLGVGGVINLACGEAHMRLRQQGS